MVTQESQCVSVIGDTLHFGTTVEIANLEEQDHKCIETIMHNVIQIIQIFTFVRLLACVCNNISHVWCVQRNRAYLFEAWR